MSLVDDGGNKVEYDFNGTEMDKDMANALRVSFQLSYFLIMSLASSIWPYGRPKNIKCSRRSEHSLDDQRRLEWSETVLINGAMAISYTTQLISIMWLCMIDCNCVMTRKTRVEEIAILATNTCITCHWVSQRVSSINEARKTIALKFTRIKQSGVRDMIHSFFDLSRGLHNFGKGRYLRNRN